MNDKTLTCKDCNSEFVFTATEQEFYKEKGFENDPQRCPKCRNARKQQKSGSRGSQREMFTATCSRCGGTATVPFRPSGDKPVYCKDCFRPANRY